MADSKKLQSTTKVADNVDRHVGAMMRARRLELNMSQEYLADRLGVSFQQVQKYERGVNRITAGRLFMLAASLDVGIAYFFRTAPNADTLLWDRDRREDAPQMDH